MGKTLTPIMFFSDEITIVPHTATHAKFIDRKVSVAEFAAGSLCKLLKVEGTDEYVFTKGTLGTPSGEFVEGPEA